MWNDSAAEQVPANDDDHDSEGRRANALFDSVPLITPSIYRILMARSRLIANAHGVPFARIRSDAAKSGPGDSVSYSLDVSTVIPMMSQYCRPSGLDASAVIKLRPATLPRPSPDRRPSIGFKSPAVFFTVCRMSGVG